MSALLLRVGLDVGVAAALALLVAGGIRIRRAALARRAACEPLADIGDALRAQDNRMTASPVFVVQRRRRTYGFDPQYTDDCVAWLHADEAVEVTPEEFERLEAKWDETGDEPDGYTRDSEGCEKLAEVFRRIGPEAQVLLQANAPDHIAAYLAEDDRTVANAGYPFSWFVDRLSGMRRRQKAKRAARSSVASTDRKVTEYRSYAAGKGPTREELAQLRREAAAAGGGS